MDENEGTRITAGHDKSPGIWSGRRGVWPKQPYPTRQWVLYSIYTAVPDTSVGFVRHSYAYPTLLWLLYHSHTKYPKLLCVLCNIHTIPDTSAGRAWNSYRCPTPLWVLKHNYTLPGKHKPWHLSKFIERTTRYMIVVAYTRTTRESGRFVYRYRHVTNWEYIPLDNRKSSDFSSFPSYLLC